MQLFAFLSPRSTPGISPSCRRDSRCGTRSFRAKMIQDWSKGREKALSLPRRFETSHGSLTLPRRLMRTFCMIVQTLVLAVLDTSHDFPLRSSVAGQFVGNDHPRDVLQSFHELAEELLSRVLVASALRPVYPARCHPGLRPSRDSAFCR